MITDNFLRTPLTEFIADLKKKKINRFYFIYSADKEKLISSRPEFEYLAAEILNNKRDFNKHEGLFFELTDKYDSLLGAFIHKTNRGQGQGGVRFWDYEHLGDFISDGLRLSEGMTRKNALAGLWWGGGKGIITHSPGVDRKNPEVRKYIFRKYGEFITSLKGAYLTAEDVGTNTPDMYEIYKHTRFCTCIPPETGGSGNPSAPTAMGVVAGMEAGLEFLGLGTLQDKTIAMQGAGNVGLPMIQFLFEKGVKNVIVCDINPENIKRAKDKFSGKNLTAELVGIDDLSIFGHDCDIFAPNATGAIINPETIPMLKAKIVCGAANNQLQNPERDGKALMDKSITYIPDFLTNRMGIVNCANEQYGYVDNDPYFHRHLDKEWEHSIYKTSLEVLGNSKKSGLSPALEAIKLADHHAASLHPIFGHRANMIIQNLVAEGWENKL